MLTDDEVTQAAELLARLPAGFLPYPIFRQVARLTVLSIVEVVPLRWRDGRLEVLLLERPADDMYAPGTLHTPGTVVRPTDNLQTYQEPFERILRDEMDAAAVAAPPEFALDLRHRIERGAENTRVFTVEVVGSPAVGAFYPVDDLPPTVMRSQLDFIPDAVEVFRRRKVIA